MTALALAPDPQPDQNPERCDFHARCYLPATRRLNGRPACAYHAPTRVALVDVPEVSFAKVEHEHGPEAADALRGFDSDSRLAAFNLNDPASNVPDALMSADDITYSVQPFQARRQAFTETVWTAGNDAAERLQAAGVS